MILSQLFLPQLRNQVGDDIGRGSQFLCAQTAGDKTNSAHPSTTLPSFNHWPQTFLSQFLKKLVCHVVSHLGFSLCFLALFQYRSHVLVAIFSGYEVVSEAQCVSEEVVLSGTEENNGFFHNGTFDHCLTHIPPIYTGT